MKYEFKIGDRVEYTANSSPSYKGRKGTVMADVSTDAPYKGLHVRFDGERHSEPLYCQSFIKIPSPPTQAEIDAALKLLGQAGDVTFKKRKPPFDPRTVERVGSYTALITDSLITVGCTGISFEKFDEIADAVADARKYNAE